MTVHDTLQITVSSRSDKEATGRLLNIMSCFEKSTWHVRTHASRKTQASNLAAASKQVGWRVAKPEASTTAGLALRLDLAAALSAIRSLLPLFKKALAEDIGDGDTQIEAVLRPGVNGAGW